MSSEWKTYTLADVAFNGKEGLIDGPFGSALPADLYQSDGIPVIRGSNLSKGEVRFKGDDFVFVSEEVASRLARATCIPEDIVFTKKGTLGQVGIIPTDRYSAYLLSSNQMRLRVNKEVVLPDFAYYYLSQKESIEKIVRDSEHTGVPKINLAYLRSFPIVVPPISEQRHITTVLNTLDDRIALLRETNATLEAMAQALFKSWFVDFDPVHANAGIRAATLPTELQALFPSTFTDTPQGLVPEGWEVIPLGEVATVVKGKSYTSKELADSHTTALVTLKSFARGGGFRMDGFKPYTGKCKPEQIVKAGDLIVAYTDVTQAAELIGKPALVVEVEEYETLIASLDVGIVRPKTNGMSRQYLYGLFCTEQFQAHTYAHTSGTTVLHLAKDAVASYEFACPPKAVIDAFSAIADGMTERKQVNADQIRTLAALRDTLLPRLISGQLRLPDAAVALAEAGA